MGVNSFIKYFYNVYKSDKKFNNHEFKNDENIVLSVNNPLIRLFEYLDFHLEKGINDWLQNISWFYFWSKESKEIKKEHAYTKHFCQVILSCKFRLLFNANITSRAALSENFSRPFFI